MLKILDISLIPLILSLLTNIKSTEVLSAQKKCGDPECETSMSRVLAIKDYNGPDCRYLSFKSGEEIMVYFKLSRKREDLWAGSKGKEFGYFPMDAVQTEEVFITKEMEVPTKETDFLCLDGGEYVFENEDRIFNHPAEENEYVSLYPDGKDSDFNMPEDEIMKLPDTSIPTESFTDNSEGDHKAEDLHPLQTLYHGDSKRRHSKTDQDESSQQEDPITQALNPVPTQSTWTVSAIAGWLGLGREENKEAVGKSSQISEQITFRRRKIAIADNADFKKQPEESEMEPQSWFQSTLTDLLHFGNEKSGLGLLYKDSNPGISSSSNTASSTSHHGRTAASEARKDRHSDSELSKSNWFDILTFGYTQKNKEQLANGEVDQNEDPLPPNIQSVSVDDGLREAAVEQVLYDKQGKYLKNNIEQTAESVVDEEQEKEKYYEEITSPDVTDTEVPLGNEHSDFMNAKASSFSTEFAENRKSSNKEQDSVSGNQIIENTQESERIKSQSGLYETIYNGIIDFNKVTSDNGLGHESPAIQSSILGQLLSSHSINNFVPIDTQIRGEENQKGSKKSQSFFSIRYFTNILDFQGFRAKENADTLEIDLKSKEKSIQLKSSDAALSIDKENKKELVLYPNIIEKELENQYTDTSQENILLFSSAGKASEKIIETIQDSELVEVNKPHLQLSNSKLKSCLSYQCIQITNNGKHKDQIWKSLEIQGYFNPEDKNIVHILEAKGQSLLEGENVADSPPEQQDFPGEDIYSYEESVVMKQKRDAGKIARPDKIEQVENSLLHVSEISVERLSKKMSGSMQEKDKSSLETHEKLILKELEELLRDFSQCKDIPDDNEIPTGVLHNGKSVIKGGREETLLERRLIIGKGGIKETNREQEAKNTEGDFNEYSSNDATDITASYVHNQKEEEGVAKNARKVAQSPFSISSSQDSVIHSVEKYSKAEELQPLSSFRRYKDLFSFQSFPDKTKNSLQEVERTKAENSQPKGSVESLQKNKEIEEKSRLHQNIAKEANLKEDIFNKDIFLLSSALQNNADSANVAKDAQLLSETIFLSSEEYFSECMLDLSFQDQKACEKNIDQPRKTSELELNLQSSTQQYKSLKRVSKSRKQYLNEIKHLDLKGLGEKTPVVCYTDVKKKIELSDPLASLQLHSEKDINNNVQEDVIDSCKENGFFGVKNVASMSPGTIKDFPVSYNEDYQLKKSVITKEDMNHFSQERAKVQMHVSKQILESNDNQQDTKKIRTTEKYPNILKQQGLPPFIAGQEWLQCEEEFYGHVRHKLHFVTHSVQKKYFQDPHMQIGEKINEANSSGTIEEYSDNAQSCDFSSVAKTNDGYAPQEQTILHYPNSHTFSKKSMHLPHMSESLTYPKEDKLKSEQKASASHVDQSDSENSIIKSIRTDKKHTNQVEYATKTYLSPNLEGEKFRILAQHRKRILNTEDTESEFQHNIAPLMLSEVASQKKTKGSLITDYNNLLLKKHGILDTSASEDLLQHLDIQREAFKSDLSINPSKLFSDEIPHHLEPLDHIMDHTPVYTKGNLDVHHLAVDLDDETFTQNRTICFKNLNHVDKLTIYGHAKVKQEKSQKDKKSEKDIVHMNKNGRSDKKGESVTSNIFDKTSCYFRKLYQKNNNNEDSTKHKSNKNIKAERHKAEYSYGQMKYECQGVNGFCYLNDKIMQWESQREICSLIQKKSITADSGKDNRKTDTLPILETGSVFQKAIQNGKLITDTGLDLKDASASRRFHKFNLKLTEESKKILQASMCDRYELQQLEQETHQYNTFIPPCEDIYKERKQVSTLAEHEHKLNTGHKKCMKTKMHLLPEVQDLMWDIRNNCGGQKTESDNGKLPGNALKEKHPLNSNKEPNNDQHSEKKKPPANTKEKLNTSGKNDLNQQDVKEKVQGNNLMNQSCTTGNESKWLLQITLHLNEFCAIITSAVSSMISISKKEYRLRSARRSIWY